ncbi:MAG: MFS transporter [Micrococcaceae bacterium]|nr:MFS transporter [Micrococcaceae bacterium]
MDTVPQGSTGNLSRGLRALVPILIALEFFSGLVQGWIIPLLGEIGRVYDVPLGATSWVLAVGLLSSAVSVPLLAVLGDRFGHRLLLVVSVVLAAAGSILIALGPSFALVLAGAAIQGPVAAFLPLAMALLKTHRGKSANRDVGLIVGTLTFGVAAGSVLGGVAMDAIGQLHLVQLIPAIALVVFIPLVAIGVPESKPDATRSVDWLGASLLGIALVGLMYGLSEAPHVGLFSTTALVPVLVGIGALVAFLAVERRAASPLVDIPAMRSARLASPMVIGFLVAVTMFGNQSPPVLFLTASPDAVGYGNSLAATGVGIVVAVSAATLTLGSLVSFALTKAFGRTRILVASCLLSAAAMLAMAFIPSSTVLFALWLALSGIGTGVVLGVLPGIVIERSSESAAASVAGVYNTARTIGGTLAGAFVASITTLLIVSPQAGGQGSAPSFEAFQLIWVTFACINILAAAVAGFSGRKSAEGQIAQTVPAPAPSSS